MLTTTAFRTPVQYSPGWNLAKQRPNEFGYVDTPIERGRPDEVVDKLPQDVRSTLIGVDITSIDPYALAKLALTLHQAGYISHDAWEELGVYQVDYSGSIDPAMLSKKSLASIRGVDDVKYGLAIRGYEADIDAVKGIRQLIEFLNGKVVDEHA